MTRFINDEKERNEFTFNEIKKSFEKHYTSCESYRRYCELHQFGPDDLNDFEDLYKIPQIPTAIFKGIDVCSADKALCKCCTSSGTKGAVSKIYRDRATITAFVESVVTGAGLMHGLKADSCVILNLGPDAEEAGDIWLAYVTGFLKNAVESYNFMHSGVVETERLIEKIGSIPQDKRIVILGAPALFMKVFHDMQEKDITLSLPENAVVFTAGGWKSVSGKAVTRDELCACFFRYFGITGDQYFDVFNQVESNTPFFECRCHRKHIPAGFLAFTRDPVSLEKLEDGEEGVLCFLDSSAESYPAFVITDDIGHITEGCECGLGGQVFSFTRRVRTVETKGCALKLEQSVAR